MLFNTLTYAYFFSAVFLATWLLRPWPRARLAVLLCSSYVFYAGWTFVGWQKLLSAQGPERWALAFQSIKYVPLLFVGTSIDWLLGVWLDRIEDPARRKLMLIGTIVVNVGVLVFFKYWNWGADTFLWLFRDKLHYAVPDIHLRVELPIGISFFCFMSLSYVVDVYRRTIPACRNYLNYLTYISFFPHLVAGPIIRGRDLSPHLERPTHLTAETGGEGLYLIAGGLFKKVVIGDFIGVNFVDRVFAEPTSYSALEALFAMYGYVVQVYCDFSGYSDIAIGSALLLGYRFKINFDQPFKSSNIVEFWRRWHVSLSTWLRDYVYFSLGGSKRGTFRKYFNVFMTMLICGIWHGAAWTYVVFGCIQGLAVALTHWAQDVAARAKKAPVGIIVVVALVASLAVDQLASAGARAFGLSGITILFHAIILGTWATIAVLALMNKLFGARARVPSHYFGVAMNFTFVALTFAMFRANSLAKVGALYERLMTFTFYAPNLHRSVLAVILGAVVLQWLPRSWGERARDAFIRAPSPVQACTLLGIAAALRWAATMEAVPFVYFQF
jgi:alginate O-acetyltransferase complex protein AlgI